MKTVRKTFLFAALASILITQSGCFGSFNLTKKVYDWNDTAVNDKFVKSLLFLGLCIVPVYEISLLVDAVVFNLIEFWSGSNPVAMEEGDSEMQLVTFKGNDYRIVATKSTFTTTQLTGIQAGEVRILKFQRSSRTWTYSDSWTCDTPGVSAAASDRVSASRSSDWALMRSTSAPALTPSAGDTASTFGSGSPASGFTDATAST